MAATVSGFGTAGLDASGRMGAGAFNVSVKKITQNPYPAKKKHLNYNPREISSQILRATKTTPAAQVLARATVKVGVLQRTLASGQYNESEVRVAVAHAKRMVKCARVKVNHLREEEREHRRNEKAGHAEKQKKRREVKHRMESKKQQLKMEAQREFQRLQQIQKQKSRNEMLQKKRRKHRDDEREKIFEAEVKFMQGDMGDDMPRQQFSDTAAVLEVSAQLRNLQMQQAAQEAEMEIAQEEASARLAEDAALPADGTGTLGTPAAVPSAGESIDISL